MISHEKDIKSQTLDFFSKQKMPNLIVIFGSASQDQLKPSSDVDIAVDLGHKLSLDEILSLSNGLALLLKREIDLIDLTVARGALLEEIIMKGNVIHQTSPEVWALLLKRLWYDKADDDYYRERTRVARLKKWPK